MLFTGGVIAGRPATVEAINKLSAVAQLKWFNDAYFNFKVELHQAPEYGIEVKGYVLA